MRRLAMLLLTFVMLLCSSVTAAAEGISVGGVEADVWISKYGNVYTDCAAQTFIDEMGYAWGDLVKVEFLNHALVLPVVPTYNHVESGEAAVIVKKDEDGSPTGNVALAINMGNFAETYGIAIKQTDAEGAWWWLAAENVSFPIYVSFSLAEKEGYLAGYLLGELTRSNERDDYSRLSDQQFANFRNLQVGNLPEGVLYRSSSPINPELGRNLYADAALEDAGVTVIMNLADNQETAQQYPDFANSYYSNQKVIYLNLGIDFTAEEFEKGLARGLKFFAENKGVYAVHCKEGKDRAGYVSALLACFAGAELEELVADYMVTYANYYGVEEGSEMYNAIAESNIVKTLKTAFEVEDLENADLKAEVMEYFKKIGLTDGEISALAENLQVEEVQLPTVPPTEDKGASLYVLFGLMATVAAIVTSRKQRAYQ